MQSKHYPTGTVRALLETDMVTPQTRIALLERLNRETTAAPRFFDAAAYATLCAVCARLIPQPERPHPIDLAGAIDGRLAQKEGDGWRYDQMPPDGEAHRRGLLALDESAQLLFGGNFHELDEAQQDQLLLLVQRNEVSGGTWETIQASRFFEELLAGATESYYSHPLAQEEIGFVGMADAHGWQLIKLDELEAREPQALEDERERV
ncbi:MAG: gluconate 2-dehydrogenase subunit 3 family protein [Pyrinomonadaceae bacterium]